MFLSEFFCLRDPPLKKNCISYQKAQHLMPEATFRNILENNSLYLNQNNGQNISVTPTLTSGTTVPSRRLGVVL